RRRGAQLVALGRREEERVLEPEHRPQLLEQLGDDAIRRARRVEDPEAAQELRRHVERLLLPRARPLEIEQRLAQALGLHRAAAGHSTKARIEIMRLPCRLSPPTKQPCSPNVNAPRNAASPSGSRRLATTSGIRSRIVSMHPAQ